MDNRNEDAEFGLAGLVAILATGFQSTQCPIYPIVGFFVWLHWEYPFLYPSLFWSGLALFLVWHWRAFMEFGGATVLFLFALQCFSVEPTTFYASGGACGRSTCSMPNAFNFVVPFALTCVAIFLMAKGVEKL